VGKITDAIDSLNALLEFSPTDAEAWSELADIYLSQGLYAQSIFALEEVLVLSPNAWNVSKHVLSPTACRSNKGQIHARLGEVLYMAATTSDGPANKYLAEAIKRFSRSIELCDDYLRGYYGLKLVSHMARIPSVLHRLTQDRLLARSSRMRPSHSSNKTQTILRCRTPRRRRSSTSWQPKSWRRLCDATGPASACGKDTARTRWRQPESYSTRIRRKWCDERPRLGLEGADGA
jgi:tetratricopeptide (TPR) repeat protein